MFSLGLCCTIYVLFRHSLILLYHCSLNPFVNARQRIEGPRTVSGFSKARLLVRRQAFIPLMLSP